MKGRKLGLKFNDLEQKEEINIQLEKNEETIQKKEERVRNLRDSFKRSNIRILGVPEGEEEGQEIKNLFEQIMKENFPNLAKEIDFQEVQEAQRVPSKLNPRKHIPKHIIITLPEIKDKERILKAAREMETDMYKGVPIRLSKIFLKSPGCCGSVVECHRPVNQRVAGLIPSLGHMLGLQAWCPVGGM